MIIKMTWEQTGWWEPVRSYVFKDYNMGEGPVHLQALDLLEPEDLKAPTLWDLCP